jgi:signal transduction histidine kinase
MPADTWTPTRRSDVFDLALAAVFAVGLGLSVQLGSNPAVSGGTHDYPRVLGIGAVAVLAATLVPRRRFPLPSLVLGTAAFAVIRLVEVPEGFVAANVLFVLLYTAGAYGGPRRDAVRMVTVAAVAVLVLIALLDVRDSPLAGPVDVGLAVLFFTVLNAVFLVAGWMLGDQVRNARLREAELAAQAEALAAAQEERAQRAVLDERLRIARELHDVLAQHVSVMGVQAAAARRVLDSRPEEVPELLGSIEATGRDAVVELQRLLGLLRDHGDGDPGGRHRIAQLPQLAEQLRDAGLDVAVDLDGVTETGPDERALPVGVELSVYRITQEALTNSLKHSGPGTRAAVSLRRRAAALELTVADDGRGAVPAIATATTATTATGQPGHGLVGMRERVALHGGELKATHRAGGGYEVRAWFPLPARGGGR